MKLVSCLICFFIVLVSITSAATAQTQSHNLPGDIVFVSREQLSSDEEYPGKYRTSLMRIDAETLEVSSFSPDDGTYIVQLLGWSPNGSLLAVLRHENGTSFDIPPQLCLFTRDGELLFCTADRPPRDPGVASDGLYRIAWSGTAGISIS
jgi:hypothetical protein